MERQQPYEIKKMKKERQSEDCFRAMIDCIKDYAIFMLDQEGNIVSWNPGAERIKGYRAEEIIGRHFSQFYPERDIQEDRPGTELKIAAEVGRLEHEGWRIRKDGSRFWANVIITAMRDESGTLYGYTKVTRDLTERKMAEEVLRQSEERFRLMVESIKDYGIFMLDIRGYIISWNPGAERIKGYSADEILGQHFSTFYPAEDIENGKPKMELEVAATEGRFEDEGWRIRKDGSTFWANVVISAVRDSTGVLRGFTKVTRDLTERRQAEEMLRQSERRLQIANKELEAFSYSVSHDLRAPLRAIAGFSQIIMEENSQEMTEKVQRLFQRIYLGADRMSHLIDDLLKFSRLSQQPLVKVSVSSESIVKDIVNRLRAEHQERQIEVTIDRLPSCIADPSLLRQVFTNLLSNAFKFTLPRKQTIIEIGAEERSDEIVYFIRDNGVGFDMRYSEKLFGVFQRLHRADEFEGTGIGLSIVQRIVYRHDGKVWAQAEEDKGATFYFSLPK